MTRTPPLQKAKEYIRTGDVQITYIGPTSIQGLVGEKAQDGPEKKGYIVTRQKKRGFTVDTCECENHSRHPDGRCAHKDAFVTMLVMKGI
jgi:hypothetical protein